MHADDDVDVGDMLQLGNETARFRRVSYVQDCIASFLTICDMRVCVSVSSRVSSLPNFISVAIWTP